MDQDDVLKELVNQFSDPMAFLRELVQNCIDAGAGEVEVRLEWSAGTMTIAVQDYGEGMTREIIETKLVRLFASSKDQDFTKIGRFGIGFVSVFALNPELVCVDTGRTGESWRVLFRRDRSYELRALEAPVEGTLVRQFTACSEEEFEGYVARGREVLRRWCRHVSIPLLYQGAPINEPFVLEGQLVARYEEPGTRVVAALMGEGSTASYFNRGLTLKDDAPSPLPFVSFLLDSRYLEHTLTRDQLLLDKHYYKAMKLVERLVERELYGALADACEAAGRAGDWDRHDRLLPSLRLLLLADKLTWRAVEGASLVRVVDGGQGELVSVKQVRKAHKAKRAVLGAAHSALSRGLASAGQLVVCGEASRALLEAAGVSLPYARDAHAVLEPVKTDPGGLCAALVALGRALGGQAGLRASVVSWERAPGLEAPCVVALDALGQVVPLASLLRPLSATLAAGAAHLCFVLDAPGARKLLLLAEDGEGALAALLAMKMALLHHGLAQADDELLGRAAARLMEVGDVG
jgi:molecular chaperone HtpG